MKRVCLDDEGDYFSLLNILICQCRSLFIVLFKEAGASGYRKISRGFSGLSEGELGGREMCAALEEGARPCGMCVIQEEGTPSQGLLVPWSVVPG